MDETGTIYALCEPDTKQPRYIGQTINLPNRLKRYNAIKCHNPHLINWLRKLKREGLTYHLEILETCSADSLSAAEIRWIADGRNVHGWQLVNHTEGGEGGARTPEVKANMVEVGKRLWEQQTFRRASLDGQAQHHGHASYDDLLLAKIMRLIRARHRQAEERTAQRERKAEQATEIRRQETRRVPLTHNKTAFLTLPKGKYAKVDLEDWERVVTRRWHANWKQQSDSKGYWRVKSSCDKRSLTKKAKPILLSRFVMDAKDSQCVRFENGNQLDCRKSNLHVENKGTGF